MTNPDSSSTTGHAVQHDMQRVINTISVTATLIHGGAYLRLDFSLTEI